MLGLDRESLFLGEDYDYNKIGYNYDLVIKNLVIRDIKGKKVKFSFYRKILLGGYYYKLFSYGDDNDLCLYDLVSKVILNNDFKYLSLESFREDLRRCLLRFINENIIVIDDIELFINNFISDIILCYNNEINRCDKIKSIVGINYNNDKWIDILKSKDRFDENREKYSRDIFVDNLLKWGIINEIDYNKLVELNKGYV